MEIEGVGRLDKPIFRHTGLVTRRDCGWLGKGMVGL